ncbi:MAG: hypothetical protein H7X70_06685 [Candidatus Kapabacteria bacterium]|nr:hypothetical protein [Candidatus Kapabacteria bacterium]
MSSFRNHIVVVVAMFLTSAVGNIALAQHLENRGTGTVRNTGTLRFKSDTGKFKNAAAITEFTNNVVEFAGTNNMFTDLVGYPSLSTAFGQDRTWRVPGLVRYKRNADSQNLQARWYTDLEVADSAGKFVPDSVYVGEDYTISLSGPRTYRGTFFYDGLQQQVVTQENGLSGTVNRYNNLTLLFSPKLVQDSDEVRMEGIFNSDQFSEFLVDGEMYWGSRSFSRAPIRVRSKGTLTTGWDISELYADVEVTDGAFVIPDDADTVSIMPSANLYLRSSDSAQLFMGDSTRLDVFGNYVNQLPSFTNAVFDTSSLVNYDGVQQPQIMQATAASHPYGHLRTARSTKTSNGDVFVGSTLSVHDTNVVMLPNRMSLTLGDAIYFDNAEVVGAFRRNLAGADTNVPYRFNNEHTFMKYLNVPQELTMDIRPITRPNAYDPTTDVYRKITVTYVGAWQATVRAAYKATDIPNTWIPEAAERLMKMYNAYPVPNEQAIKLTPTVPPTYSRRPINGAPGFGYVELFGIQDVGADNLRLDNGNDLLLRASRDVLKAVATGRWSNPFTWDEAREPEPIDRVIIDGFTVHVGYLRASDNYGVAEAYPDSMSTNVVLGSKLNTALLFGSTNTFNTFSLVPTSRVALIANRAGTTQIPVLLQDLSASALDGGLVVYTGSTFITPNLTLTPAATAFVGGVLQIGIP